MLDLRFFESVKNGDFLFGYKASLLRFVNFGTLDKSFFLCYYILTTFGVSYEL